MITALINALTIFGILLCLGIVLLSRSIYRLQARNPLLLLSGFMGVLGVVVFALAMHLRSLPGGEFPSIFVGVLMWGFIIVGLMFLLIILSVNKWFPGLWRGSG